MFLLSKPTQEQIDSIIDRNRNAPFSYEPAGCTKNGQTPVPGFVCDHNRVLLGHGSDTFAKAKLAIRNWKMFDFDWSHLCWPDVPIESGQVVAATFRHFGFWSLNLCRIVYVIDDKGTVERFGFAYGTLPEHVERGEEKFTVEWNHDDDSVWYDILAVSQPAHILARLGYPIARYMQRNFVKESKAAMIRAVSSQVST
ncbi:MAG TPA: DUF1990 domain-containing protein [Blastocatellia bacterium]|nr:DUF1990 domain-containing protein [Blastocatellia bacterium]